MTAVSVRSPPPPPPVSFVDWGPEEQADSDAETAVAAPIAPVYFRKVRRCTVPPAESSIGGSGDRVRRYDVLRPASAATIGAARGPVKSPYTNGAAARGRPNDGVKWRKLTHVSAGHRTWDVRRAYDAAHGRGAK